MARKNRKKKVDGFAFPAPFAGIAVLGVCFALCYVWLDCRCEAVGRQLKRLEGRRAELRKVLLTEEYQWTRTKAPANIDRSLARYGMVMTWPRPDQIVRMRRPERAPSSLSFENTVASYTERRIQHE